VFPIETPSYEELPQSLSREVFRILDAAQSRETPVFIHTLGIPGAGKTTFARLLHSKLPDPKPSLVYFDGLMESMPEYKAEPDPVKAFDIFEEPARAAGYLLLKNLIEKKSCILLDHSGSRADHVEMLRYAKQFGYRVIVARIVADKSTVKERILKRQEIEERFTPLNYVDERELVINGLLDQYKMIADFYMEVPNEDGGNQPWEYLSQHCDEVLAAYNRLISV